MDVDLTLDDRIDDGSTTTPYHSSIQCFGVVKMVLSRHRKKSFVRGRTITTKNYLRVSRFFKLRLSKTV